jgi:hypothetical protein
MQPYAPYGAAGAAVPGAGVGVAGAAPYGMYPGAGVAGMPGVGVGVGVGMPGMGGGYPVAGGGMPMGGPPGGPAMMGQAPGMMAGMNPAMLAAMMARAGAAAAAGGVSVAAGVPAAAAPGGGAPRELTLLPAVPNPPSSGFTASMGLKSTDLIFYDQLFRTADVERNGQLSAAVCKDLLVRSKLDKARLMKVRTCRLTHALSRSCVRVS